MKITEKSLVSLPYLLFATQVYFVSICKRIVAKLVLFASTVEFLTIAVYIGGVPVAEQDIL